MFIELQCERVVFACVFLVSIISYYYFVCIICYVYIRLSYYTYVLQRVVDDLIHSSETARVCLCVCVRFRERALGVQQKCAIFSMITIIFRLYDS